MKEYKVEAKAFYSKLTTNKDHIVESSMEWIQHVIDDNVEYGWNLSSTDSTSFGAALYVHLYFEREKTTV